MPLDTKSLDLDRWQTSARLRDPGGDAAGVAARAHAISHLQALASARRHATEKRRDFRQAQQRQRRPTDDEADATAETPAVPLNRQAIKLAAQRLQTAEEEAQQAHQLYLETFPNYIDEAVTTTLSTTTRTPTGTSRAPSATYRSAAAVVLDDNPLYELQLYERWTPDRVVWTHQGRQLQRAVLEYLTAASVTHGKTETLVDAHIWELPSTLPLSMDVVRRFGGEGNMEESGESSHRQTPDAASLQIDAPSWMALLEQNLAQHSLTDKQLPVVHVLTGPIVADATPRAEGLSQRSAWYRALASDMYLTCVVVTGPSLVADSRPLQHTLAQQWQSTLAALYTDHPSSTRTIQINVTPAQDLHAYESSRLVLCVVDKHKSSQHTADDRDNIPLVSIANLESYGSRSLKHQATHEALHVLLVQVAPLSVLLDGLVRATASTVYPQETDEVTVWKVPTVVHAYTTVQMYPIVRRMVLNKKGRRTLQMVERTQAERKTTDPNTTRATTTTTTHETPAAATATSRLRVLSNGVPSPSRQQIQAEALASPYEFLPFYK